MFSGIIETTGKIISKSVHSLSIKCEFQDLFQDLNVSDSISVDGICLTIVDIENKRNNFKVEIIPETLSRTNLKYLTKGDEVNLERSVKYGGRIGGHLVQGHVDGIGLVKRILSEENSKIIQIELSENLLKYCVEKGYIAINGISLTLKKIEQDKSFIEVAVIPYTNENTNIKNIINGTILNIEVDITGKYIKNFMNTYI